MDAGNDSEGVRAGRPIALVGVGAWVASLAGMQGAGRLTARGNGGIGWINAIDIDNRPAFWIGELLK